MDQLGPEVLLAFALVGLALMICAWAIVRKLRGAAPAHAASTVAPVVEFKPAPPAAATAPAAAMPRPAPQPAPQPVTQMPPMSAARPAAAPAAPQTQPVSAPRQPSYTELAATAGGLRPSAPACTRARIDYANEATEPGAAPSYAALAVANLARAARNMPPLSATAAPAASSTPAPTAAPAANAAPARANGSGQSYAAVAVATVGEFTAARREVPSPRRIDYSNMPAEAIAGASYTAIAVASAARAP
ncbi:MAG: hypothetical protein K2Y42_08030 [Hyphomicrobium sp.]|jgi:hypothetical protein|uniref:hypothetical protein n=1 Tax=Hyphomicrobium sp. TaxID=82 RepID=UPI0025B88D22|nr:hypothetical protein [Hyphomicrobium sp.]MBX9862688.1 hypothetical protein [Hyphomicrobium sp.]